MPNFDDIYELQAFLDKISYDPSEDKVIGVTDYNCHVLLHDENDYPIVLLIPIDVFHETWDNWLEGKRSMCERYNHYCGVLGSTKIEDAEILEDSEITIFHKGEEVKPFVVQVWEFSPFHDFEHG